MPGLSKQSQNGLSCLGGQTQCGRAEGLAGLQHQHVRAFLVHVGKRQLVCAFRDGIDHPLDPILTGVDNAESRRQSRSLCLECVRRPGQAGNIDIDIRVGCPLVLGGLAFLDVALPLASRAEAEPSKLFSVILSPVSLPNSTSRVLFAARKLMPL